MLSPNLDKIISLLKEFTHRRKSKLEIILIGGLALSYYGMRERTTTDIDAEIKGDVESLSKFLKSKNIPTNIGEDISRWSLIGLPVGYRKRALIIYKDKLLKVKVLSPIDFIITKLRRFTEEDLKDALFVAKKFEIKPQDIRDAAENVIERSPKDTELFVFKRNVELFIKKVKST